MTFAFLALTAHGQVFERESFTDESELLLPAPPLLRAEGVVG